MFTATKIGETRDIQAQRKTIVVQVTDGVTEFSKPFSFSLDASADVQKKAVAAYLEEINANPDSIPDNSGDFTVTPPIVTPPTQAELDRQEWESDVAKLKKAYSDMLNLGVVPKPAFVTAIEALRVKIANNAKAEYLG